MDSLQGQFLVASPCLMDENFHRSVVLMLEHDEEGAFGLIINRPSNDTVKKVWGDETDLDDFIYLGGPVSGPVMALHSAADLSECEVIEGVHLATHKDSLNCLAKYQLGAIRFFSSYSGWGAGQLDEEIRQGGWLVTPASQQDVFADPGSLWERVTQRIGRHVLGSRLTDNAPDDPSFN